MGKVTENNRKPGSARVGTNLFAKDMRVISDKYREGYERTFRNKKKKTTQK